MNLRRAFLWTVLASLALCALAGIASLLLDLRTDRWLLSMLSVGMFSLLSLSAASTLEKRVWVRPMQATIAGCILGAILYVYAIWNHYVDDDYLGLAITWTGSLTAAGAVAATRFEAPWSALRWSTLALIFTFAALMTFGILAPVHDEFYQRCTAATAIAAGLGVVGLPILHKVKGIKLPSDVVTTPLELSLTCPRCLLTQTLPAGDSRCTRCKLKFTLQIEEPRCPECNYLLYRLTTPRCPECGHTLAPDDVESPSRSVIPTS